MSAKLTIFKELACFYIEHRHFPLGNESGREETDGCVDGSDKIRHCWGTARAYTISNQIMDTLGGGDGYYHGTLSLRGKWDTLGGGSELASGGKVTLGDGGGTILGDFRGIVARQRCGSKAGEV